jgi:hypothetical protein
VNSRTAPAGVKLQTGEVITTTRTGSPAGLSTPITTRKVSSSAMPILEQARILLGRIKTKRPEKSMLRPNFSTICEYSAHSRVECGPALLVD